jgi:hypothetical protein
MLAKQALSHSTGPRPGIRDPSASPRSGITDVYHHAYYLFNELVLFNLIHWGFFFSKKCILDFFLLFLKIIFHFNEFPLSTYFSAFFFFVCVCVCVCGTGA